MKLMGKVITLIMIFTLLPLIIMGYFINNDLNKISEDVTSLEVSTKTRVDDMANLAVKDSTNSLQNLGNELIKQKAVDVAKQLEIYILSNPTKTVADLQKDPVFSKIAVQPVGKTGYTAITDVDTLVCRFHVNPAIVNLDLSKLATKLPGFWGVMSKTRGGVVSEGQYDWLEPDNKTIRQKYMYIAMVDAKTADGVRFSVAATTYMDEFSQPVIATSKIIDENREAIKKGIADAAKSTQDTNTGTQNSILLIGIIVLFAAIVSGIMFAKTITDPLKKLSKAGNDLAEGNLEINLPTVTTNDEIKDLSNTMSLLVGAITFLKKNDTPKESQKEAKKK